MIWCCRFASNWGNCLGAGFSKELVFCSGCVLLLIRFLHIGGELLIGYVSGIRLRVRPFLDSLSDI